MAQTQPTAQEALNLYKDRVTELHDELHAINRDLRSQDLIALASRTRELLRRTKGLLDGNIPILFADQPPRVYEELYHHIEYAQGHLTKALAEEYDFDVIKKRLYMATALSEYVVSGVAAAIGRL